MNEIDIGDVMLRSEVAFGTSRARGLMAQMTAEVCYAYAAAFWQAVGMGIRSVIGHGLRPSLAIAAASAAALTDLAIEVGYAGALSARVLPALGRTFGVPCCW